MSDQANGNPVEVEALALGWLPKEQFKGDPTRWTDAETFVERGHTLMPILRKNNEQLVGKLSKAERDAAAAIATAQELKTSMEKILEFQASEVKRQVEERLATLKAARKQARRDGDDDKVDELDDAIEAVKEEKVTPPTPAPAAKSKSDASEPEPWAVAFHADNSDWLGVDKKKTAIFAAAAEEHFGKGLRGADVLAAAKKDMDAFFAPSPGSDKAEGGGGGGGGGGGPRGSTGFSSLPAEAKEVCRSQELQMVGKNKPFKTAAEWQKHYADVYNAS